MSLLNAFLMTYETKNVNKVISENKKVEEATDKVEKEEKNLEEQNKKLGDSFKNLSEKGLDGFLKKCIYALTPVALFSMAVKKGLDFITQGEQLEFLAIQSGMAVDKLQALATATRNYGGSTEATASSISNLNQQLQNLRKGEGGGGLEEAAYKYGIQISGENGLKNAEQLLEEVARKMESLDDRSKIDLAQTMGIDEGTTRLLMQGLDSYKKQVSDASKYNVYNKKDIENARQFMTTLRQIGQGLLNIAGNVARILLPILNTLGKGVKEVVDFIINHNDLIKGMLIAIGVVLSSVLIPLIGSLAVATWGWLAPLLPIIALITFIGLLIEDIFKWINGGESVLKDLADFLGSVFIDSIKKIKESFVEFFGWLKNKGKQAIGFINPKNWFKKGQEVDGNFEDFENLDLAKQSLQSMDNFPLSGISNNAISNMSNLYNQNKSNDFKIDNININVENGNPQTISNSIGGELQQTIMGLQQGMI